MDHTLREFMQATIRARWPRDLESLTDAQLEAVFWAGGGPMTPLDQWAGLMSGQVPETAEAGVRPPVEPNGAEPTPEQKAEANRSALNHFKWLARTKQAKIKVEEKAPEVEQQPQAEAS